MAGKSEYSQKLDEFQHRLDHQLKPIGFKRTGRTYNRTRERGVIQIINLQLGKPQPLTAKLPIGAQHLRPDLAGKFTINLGVYVREISQAQFAKQKEKKSVKEYECALRIRLGRFLGSGRQDYWWDLDKAISSIFEDVDAVLATKGIPFLERFSTRDAIIKGWIEFNRSEMHLSNISRLHVGIILAARGDTCSAADLFREHLKLPQLNSGHPAYVQSLANKLGLGLL